MLYFYFYFYHFIDLFMLFAPFSSWCNTFNLIAWSCPWWSSCGFSSGAASHVYCGTVRVLRVLSPVGICSVKLLSWNVGMYHDEENSTAVSNYYYSSKLYLLLPFSKHTIIGDFSQFSRHLHYYYNIFN